MKVLLTFSFGLNACIRLLHLASSLSMLLTYTLQTIHIFSSDTCQTDKHQNHDCNQCIIQHLSPI